MCTKREDVGYFFMLKGTKEKTRSAYMAPRASPYSLLIQVSGRNHITLRLN